MEALFVIGGILLVVFGAVLGRYLIPSISSAVAAQLQTAQSEARSLTGRLAGLEASHREAQQDAEKLRIERAQLTERRDSLAELSKKQADNILGLEHARQESSAKLVTLTGETSRLHAETAAHHQRNTELELNIEGLKAETEKLRQSSLVVQQALSEARSEVAAAREREDGLRRVVDEQPIREAEQHARMKSEFENLATAFLKRAGADISEGSRKEFDTILTPLKLRLEELGGHLDTEKRDIVALKTEIKHVVEATLLIGNKADGLANALRNDSQRRGRWGELALERILEAAGLAEGRDYITQGRGLSLRHEDGAVQRPDVIVNLPGDRCFIIDSKVSLVGYELLLEADADALPTARTRFVRDVKAHIDALASKEYQQNKTLQAHESVLMFVPIEGAISAALNSDPELFRYGWDRGVIVVGPANLMMAMQSTAAIWRYEDQNRNAKEIASLAGQLCDKITSSIEDFQLASNKIQDAAKAQNEALKRLGSGRGNVLSLGSRIRDMGVAPKKVAPVVIIDGVTLSGDENDETGAFADRRDVSPIIQLPAQEE